MVQKLFDLFIGGKFNVYYDKKNFFTNMDKITFIAFELHFDKSRFLEKKTKP